MAEIRPVSPLFKLKRIFRGEIFTAIWCFGAISVIKLGSSLVLTRLLYPEAFGIITILFSIVFVLEMLGDVGIVGLLIRHEKGNDPRFYNTLWTVRLGRSVLNGLALFALAPYLAHWYGVPELSETLRIFSIWFLFFGLESMSFVLAVRNKQTQPVNYTQLLGVLVSSTLAIGYSFVYHDHLGMVYGTIIDRALVSAISYRIYPNVRPRFVFDREALRELFDFAKYVMPSSTITLVIVQFDKVIFLKLFSLKLLGIYGLAGNIIAPVDALTSRLCHTLLYPRCAENFRKDPLSFVPKYYTEVVWIHALLLVIPASLLGIGSLLIDILYDDRYQQAGLILQVFAMRSILATLAATSEDMLVASGRVRIQFYGNVIRLFWFIPAVLTGYWLFGFEGFLFMAMLEMLPTTLFYYFIQFKNGLMIMRYELVRLAFAAAVAGISYLAALGTYALIR